VKRYEKLLLRQDICGDVSTERVPVGAGEKKIYKEIKHDQSRSQKLNCNTGSMSVAITGDHCNRAWSVVQVSDWAS